MVWQKCLCSGVFSVWEWLSEDKIDLLTEARPHIYTWYCRNKRYVKDHCESSASERPLGDSQRFPNYPKGSYDCLWVVLTHRKRFLAIWWPWSQAGGQVAMRMCWEHILNKVLPNLEGKLKLSKATVSDGSVASFGLKLILNKYVKFENSCSTISRQIQKYSNIVVIKGFCKSWIYIKGNCILTLCAHMIFL